MSWILKWYKVTIISILVTLNINEIRWWNTPEFEKMAHKSWRVSYSLNLYDKRAVKKSEKFYNAKLIFRSSAALFVPTIFWSGTKQRFCFRESMFKIAWDYLFDIIAQNGISKWNYRKNGSLCVYGAPSVGASAGGECRSTLSVLSLNVSCRVVSVQFSGQQCLHACSQ